MPKKGEKRAPHKEDCQCVVCRSTRMKAAEPQAQPAPAREPLLESEVDSTLVLSSSLKPNDIFEFAGKTYRAGRKGEEFTTGVDTMEPGAVPITLGLNVMVKLIS